MKYNYEQHYIMQLVIKSKHSFYLLKPLQTPFHYPPLERRETCHCQNLKASIDHRFLKTKFPSLKRTIQIFSSTEQEKQGPWKEEKLCFPSLWQDASFASLTAPAWSPGNLRRLNPGNLRRLRPASGYKSSIKFWKFTECLFNNTLFINIIACNFWLQKQSLL